MMVGRERELQADLKLDGETLKDIDCFILNTNDEELRSNLEVDSLRH